MPDQQAETPPDFVQIGAGLASGMSDVVTSERAKNIIFRALQEAFGVFLNLFLQGFAKVSAWIAGGLVKGEARAEDSLSELSAVAVNDLLGTNISPSALRTRGGGGGRGNVGDALGAAILTALFPRPSSLEPSDAPAQRYIANAAKFGLEGWLSGFTMEFLSSMWGPFGHLETFGELDDILAKTIGFEGLSRSGLGPYVDTLIRTPADWHVNKLYRPTLLSPTAAAQQYFRGRWPLEQVFEELARQGYSQERIEALLNSARKTPSVTDLYLLYRYGQISEAEGIQRLRDEGWEEADARRVWLAQRVRRIESYQSSLANVAVTAYANRRIEPGDLDRILGGAVTDPEERGRLREIAESRRTLNTKDLSDSEARDAVIRGILSIVDYRRLLENAGYTSEAVTVKELMLRDVIRSKEEAAAERARIEAEREAEAAAREEERRRRQEELEAERAVTEPSLSQARRFVVRGIWDSGTFAGFLAAEKYDAATIAALLEDVAIDRDAYLAQQAKRDETEQRAARKQLSLGQLEAAVLRGVLTLADYRQALGAAGFAAAEVDVLARTLQARIDEQRALEERRAQIEAESDIQRISLSQAEQALLRGIGTIADYDAWLRSQGYTDFDRTVLVQLAAAKIADQAAAEQRRAEQEAAAARRNVPLAETRRAVLLGVRPLTAYQAALAAAGIVGAEAVLLVDLLEAELAQRAADARRREEAEAQRGVRALSIAQLEALVRAELLTPDQYRAELRASGFEPRDVELLTALLLDTLEEERRRRDDVEREETPPPAPALTLAQLERAVRGGLLAIDAYETALRGRGYSDVDVAVLSGLIRAELEADDAAEDRRAELLTEDPARALTVSQLERSVRAGVQTLDDYERALRALQFAPLDAALLTAVFARELGDVVWAADRRDTFYGGAGAVGPSVAAAEQAAIAGQLPVDAYRRELDALGVDLASQTALLIWLEWQRELTAAAAAAAAEG